MKTESELIEAHKFSLKALSLVIGAFVTTNTANFAQCQSLPMDSDCQVCISKRIGDKCSGDNELIYRHQSFADVGATLAGDDFFVQRKFQEANRKNKKGEASR